MLKYRYHTTVANFSETNDESDWKQLIDYVEANAYKPHIVGTNLYFTMTPKQFTHMIQLLRIGPNSFTLEVNQLGEPYGTV